MFDEWTIILKCLSYSTETGNRNLQHVLQKCWKRVVWRCCAFCYPHIKPVLQQIRLLQVAWILTYDWIKLRRSHTIYGSYVTLSKTRLLWAAKCRTTLKFLRQFFTACNNMIYRKDISMISLERQWFRALIVGTRTASYIVWLERPIREWESLLRSAHMGLVDSLSPWR